MANPKFLLQISPTDAPDTNVLDWQPGANYGSMISEGFEIRVFGADLPAIIGGLTLWTANRVLAKQVRADDFQKAATEWGKAINSQVEHALDAESREKQASHSAQTLSGHAVDAEKEIASLERYVSVLKETIADVKAHPEKYCESSSEVTV